MTRTGAENHDLWDEGSAQSARGSEARFKVNVKVSVPDSSREYEEERVVPKRVWPQRDKKYGSWGCPVARQVFLSLGQNYVASSPLRAHVGTSTLGLHAVFDHDDQVPQKSSLSSWSLSKPTRTVA